MAELNEFVSYSAFFFGAAQLLLVWNILRSWNGREKAGADPGGGWSLEWTTSSPPPHNSFTEIPTLQVAEPSVDEEDEPTSVSTPTTAEESTS
jgi:heme/copper-type cytochrome/quinol oxidase subunit 1